jgi:hypothetical protein
MIRRHRGHLAFGRQQSVKIRFVTMAVEDIHSIRFYEFPNGKSELQIQPTSTCENGVRDIVPGGFFRNFLMGIVNISDDAEDRLTMIRFLQAFGQLDCDSFRAE